MTIFINNSYKPKGKTTIKYSQNFVNEDKKLTKNSTISYDIFSAFDTFLSFLTSYSPNLYNPIFFNGNKPNYNNSLNNNPFSDDVIEKYYLPIIDSLVTDYSETISNNDTSFANYLTSIDSIYSSIDSNPPDYTDEEIIEQIISFNSNNY